MTAMNEISVAEALHKIEVGESISGYQINFDHLKVEALDVMKLTKHGIAVPEYAIYYDDEDIILDDEDFAGTWEPLITIRLLQKVNQGVFQKYPSYFLLPNKPRDDEKTRQDGYFIV